MKFLSIMPMAVAALVLGSTAIARAESYPPKVVSDFKDACAASAKQSAPSLSPTIVDSYCQCAIDQIQTRLTLNDFVGLDKSLSSGEKLSDAQAVNVKALNESVEFCAKQQAPDKTQTPGQTPSQTQTPDQTQSPGKTP
jgi:hypothetical protein